MTREEILEVGAAERDVLYVTLKSNVLKVGSFLGYRPRPDDAADVRFCFALHPKGEVVEFLRDEYIKRIQVVARAAH
jgi:hypothetical protein